MVTSIELTQADTEAFNDFFSTNAKPGVNMQAVLFEVLDVLADRAGNAESLSYELRSQYTVSGRPELLYLSAEHVTVSEEADE